MKIFALCNSDLLGFNTIKSLHEQGHLAGLAVLQRNKKILEPRIMDLGIESEKVHYLSKASWVADLGEMLKDTGADVVWVLTFPWKIPASLLSIPPKGFINFHFGMLPKYKGSDPIFWQFKNREKHGGLTVHLMNEEIDEGPVILQEPMPILPGENYGLHAYKLSGFTPSLIPRIIAALEDENFEYLQLETPDQIYDQSPTEADLTIDWKSQTAEEIEWLINAANPNYKGAATQIGQLYMRILEVTPVNMEGEFKAEPGQIVHSDVVYGLVVACADMECIRITVVQTREGFLSGVKLFNLGYMVGQKFE